MKKLSAALLFLITTSLHAQDRPKLVVGIVVDQMKMDYLYRFYNDYSENGFKKLVTKGYTFHNTHYNYVPTYTAPGHATIYTGATPNVHGIVGNEWFHRSLGKNVYCTDDASVKTIGTTAESELKSPMSPKNLQATTITDELRLSTNFKGKVIGMSLKDRGAILPAGHFANWAFWLGKTGDFISSTFYGEQLPTWVSAYNAEKRYLKYLNSNWNLLKPAATYNESLTDDNHYESKLYGSKTPTFPYNLNEMLLKNDPSIIRSVPFGNDLLADFAMKSIEMEQLGKDATTDFLTISFSSTDYVGHDLGPRSIELQDTYLRLDQTLATLLNYLDKNVGKNNYLLFLTADHAGAENATFLKDNKYDVNTIAPKEIAKALSKFSVDVFGDDFLLNYSNFNVYLKKEVIKSKGLDFVTVKQAFKEFLLTQNQVKFAFTEEEILASNGSNYFLDFIAKGYDVTQNGDIVLIDKPGFIEYKATGTSHGTAYSYDTHVPLFFYGWKIKKGASFDKKYITEIAPTLALKLKITLPNGTESKVLTEVLGN